MRRVVRERAVVSDVFYHGRLRSADVVTAESHALPPALVAANPWFGDHLAFHDVAYGTVVSRAASYANGAEVEFVARILEVLRDDLGFSVGDSSACVFYHRERHLSLIHI